jgi:arylsulfatase A-like enzyme
MDIRPRAAKTTPTAIPMSRCPAFSLVMVVAVCLAAAACSKPRDGDALCADCNVILISMDTVRADRLGIYGHDRDTSPNVDRWAQSAFVFENAISQSAWTLPGHGSMLTGLYPSRLGVSHYPAKRSLPNVRSLAEEFSRAGYATAAFTGGGFVAAHFGFSRGFDVYSSDGRRFEHNLEQALAWLRNTRDRRFFLFLHGYDAHRPYYSAGQHKLAVGLTGKRTAEQRGFCTKGDREKPANLDVVLQYYDAAIRHGDASVGRFLDELAVLGLADRTVLLITSDHGEEFFEHGNCDHVRFLYREIVGVPYILRVPGTIRETQRIADVIPASISVPRTLLEIVGVQTDLPGASVVPLLRGERSPFRTVYSETDSVAGSLGSRGATIALTNARYRLISYPQEGSDEGYDVEVDRAEKHVLPESSPVYQLRSTLRAWYRSMVATDAREWRKAVASDRGEDVGPTGDDTTSTGANEQSDEAPELPDAIRRQLESLGYLEE